MTINVKRVFDALNLNIYHSSRFISLPNKDEMSYDELNAWYKTRLRHHQAINIFFHALAILLTGPFFHLIWFLAIRPWYSHPNWLMTNRHFSSAHKTLIAIEEQLAKHRPPEEDEISTLSEDDVISTDSEISALSNSDLDETLEDTTENPKSEILPVNIHAILETKDVRNLWWKFLDDQTLIQSFIKPVYKKGREYALNELFSRKSGRATEYRHNYLRYYLSHNLILEQSLSSTQLTELSKKYPTELGFFALALTARVKFGEVDAPHAEAVLNKMSSLGYKNPSVSHHYQSDILRCKIILNGLDIPLYLQSYHHKTQHPHFHFYGERIQHQQKIIIDAIDGDITQVNLSFREDIIDCMVETLIYSKKSYFHRISFENWSIKEQQKLIKALIWKLSYSWIPPQIWTSHFNLDQLDENVLQKFIDELFSLHRRQISENMLCHLLVHTKKTPVILQIVEKSLIGLDFPILCHVNLDDLTDELKEKYLNLLLLPYPNDDRSLYICKMLRKLDFTKIREYENRLISNVLDHSSTHFRLNFLVSQNFSTLTEENQNSLIEKILPELFSNKDKNLNFSVLVKVSPTLQNDIAKMAIFSDLDDVENNTTKVKILCALDLQVIEIEIREAILKLLKDELINPRGVPLYKELSRQFSLIKLSVDEQNRLTITLRDYINSFLNTPLLGDTAAKKIQRDNFCQNGLHALEFISLEKLNKDDSTFFFTWLRWILLNTKTQPQDKVSALKTLSRFDLNTLDEKLQTKHINRLFKLIGCNANTRPFLSMGEIAAEILFSRRLQTLSESLQHLIVRIIINYINYPKYASGSQAKVIAWVYSELPQESDYRRQIKQALIDGLAFNCPLHYKTLCLILSPNENTKLNKRYFQSAKSTEKLIKLLPYFWFSANKKQKDLFLSEDTKKNKFEDSVENSIDNESSVELIA